MQTINNIKAIEWGAITLHIVFFASLSLLYTTYIVTIYGYQGYEDKINVFKLLLATPAIIISSLFVQKKGLPSNFFLHMAIALIVTPSMVIYSCSDLPNEFALITTSSFIIMATVTSLVRLKTIKSPKIGNRKLLIILSLLSALFIASLFAFGGARFINFDLSAVYDLRRDAAQNLPDIYAYITSLFSKVIIPFGLIFSLVYRKWILAITLAVYSILLFALTAHKAPLIYPFLIVAIYWISNKNNITKLFLLAATLITILSGIDFWLSINTNNPLYGWLGSILGRRALIVPSDLNWRYYEFFSINQFYFWSQSKITIGLISQPYHLGPANIIGEAHFGNADTSANTGWIGSGFANAGYIGVYLYSIAIGLFFSFIDAYSRKLGTRTIISLFVLPVMTITTSSDLLTSLLTHGLVVSIILLMIVKPTSAFQKYESPL